MTDTKPILYVGLMGYSSQKFDRNLAQSIIVMAFSDIANEYPDHEICIVSGYTDLGIPAIGYREAVVRNWKTVGVACAKANSGAEAGDWKLFPCDEVKIVGENWGNESLTFLTMCHVFVRVGGGKQTIAETKAAKDFHKPVYEFDLETLQ